MFFPESWEATIYLIWARLSLRKRAQAEVYRQWRQSKAFQTGEPDPEQRQVAHDLGQVLAKSADRLPLSCSCLVQSVALLTMLRRRGIFADLRIGVAKGAYGIKAHAWVQYGNEVVLDSAINEAYIPFESP